MNRSFILLLAFIGINGVLIPAANCTPTEQATASQAGSSLGATHYGSHLAPILKCVNASADQRVKITAIVLEFRPKIEPSLLKYKEKRDQFLSAIMTGKPAEDIMTKQEEVNQLFSLVTNQYCMMHLKVRKCLNPEQITAYEAYRKQQGWTAHH